MTGRNITDADHCGTITRTGLCNFINSEAVIVTINHNSLFKNTWNMEDGFVRIFFLIVYPEIEYDSLAHWLLVVVFLPFSKSKTTIINKSFIIINYRF
jgi:hypothetical protein